MFGWCFLPRCGCSWGLRVRMSGGPDTRQAYRPACPDLPHRAPLQRRGAVSPPRCTQQRRRRSRKTLGFGPRFSGPRFSGPRPSAHSLRCSGGAPMHHRWGESMCVANIGEPCHYKLARRDVTGVIYWSSFCVTWNEEHNKNEWMKNEWRKWKYSKKLIRINII